MVHFNIPVQNTLIEIFVKGDHDRVGFYEDITCAGGDKPIAGCYLAVNSDLYSFSTNMVGIIIST